MKATQFIGFSVAAIWALASPLYAGHLGGGAVGGFGGSLGGSLGSLGSGGAFASQGGLNGSFDSMDAHALRHSADKTAAKGAAATQTAASKGGDAKMNASQEAAAVDSVGKPSKRSAAPAKAATPPAEVAQPSRANTSANMTATDNEMISGGNRSVSGNSTRSVEAQR